MDAGNNYQRAYLDVENSTVWDIEAELDHDLRDRDEYMRLARATKKKGWRDTDKYTQMARLANRTALLRKRILKRIEEIMPCPE